MLPAARTAGTWGPHDPRLPSHGAPTPVITPNQEPLRLIEPFIPSRHTGDASDVRALSAGGAQLPCADSSGLRATLVYMQGGRRSRGLGWAKAPPSGSSRHGVRGDVRVLA